MTAEQLKNSILQMAVQGKLVPQDPNDEPASELIKRIREEKENLIKEGKIKKEKNPSYIFRGEDNIPYEKVGKNEPVSIADEVPFEIPGSWEWVRLSEIVTKEIKRGRSPKYAESSDIQVFAQKCNVKTGGIDMSLAKFLDVAAFEKYPIEEYMQNNDIVINSTGNGTLGRIGILHDSDRVSNATIVPDSHVTVIRTVHVVSIDYVYYVLKYYQPFLESLGEGSTNQTELRPTVISQLFFPLPPRAEQKRIADKLVSLMPFIDKYNSKENALSHLNKEFPEVLKKSILQEAVMGKLIPQDENDEPASVLLERIRKEKQRLIAEGKLKKDKHESIIYRRDNSHYEKLDGVERCIDDEIPFEIPPTWNWSRLNYCLDVRDGTHDTPKYVNDGVPLVTSKNLCDGHIDFSNVKFISREDHEAISLRSKVDKEDILFAMIGSIGNPVLYHGNVEFSIKNMALFKHIQNGMYMEYVYWWLLLSQDVMKKQASGGVQSFVSLNYLRNYFIPVPPYDEQKRIAERIKKLSTICESI